ncbi:unnamed protein product, partial [Timema podura]|nr:unnamed protein product [Timema podura]
VLCPPRTGFLALTTPATPSSGPVCKPGCLTWFSWLLTRDKSPSSETLKAIDDILIANNLQGLPYNDTPQTC